MPGPKTGPDFPMLAARSGRWKLAALAAVFAAGCVLGAIGLAPQTGIGIGPAAAQDSGARVPRMVSLGADEVNVRTGPGIRFPVKWVFRRAGMPVMVLAEYDTWRKIRDWEGAEGWVHRAMLSGRPTVLVTRPEITLRRNPQETAPAVARLADGMVARVDGCDGAWCRLAVQGYEGWALRAGLWGLEADASAN